MGPEEVEASVPKVADAGDAAVDDAAVDVAGSEEVELMGGPFDGLWLADVLVVDTAVLLMRETLTETWWTYERYERMGKILRTAQGRAVYRVDKCVGQTGLALFRGELDAGAPDGGADGGTDGGKETVGS